jgi:hypothetical protein
LLLPTLYKRCFNTPNPDGFWGGLWRVEEKQLRIR